MASGEHVPSPALRPPASDEGRHPPGSDPLWNESWYFDFATPDGSLGGYARLGLYPNLGVAWSTAYLCGPARPAVAMVDFEAPLPPGDRLAGATADGPLECECQTELERWRVTFDGTGDVHDDPAAVLRGDAADARTAVGLDLTWETLGEPYAYRFTTRYEIPCRVSGRVRIGDEEIEVQAVGQRDHSWGTRDWWAMDWVWSAGHLDDGTRVHGVELRIPGAPPLSVGYVQPGDGGVDEPDAVAASEQVRPDGLIASATLDFRPGPTLSVEPIAFAPLRLTSQDGRVASFPRAMCRVRADDGRTGVAWMEWNRNSAG